MYNIAQGEVLAVKTSVDALILNLATNSPDCVSVWTALIACQTTIFLDIRCHL